MKRTIFTVLFIASLSGYGFSKDVEAKLTEFRNVFPKSDIDGDGRVSRTEMEKFLLKKVSSKDTSANSPLMKRFLKNAPGADGGDGVMTKTEMIKYIRNYKG